MISNLKDQNIFDVIIIGGGASGMMAAAVAGKLGKSVLILEKNKSLGEKLKITGGGRCNITNAEEDIRLFVSNYGLSGKFLYTPFSIFGVKDTFKYFERLGLPLVVQARKRAFPYTEKAEDVYLALKRELDKYDVYVKLNSPVTRFDYNDSSINSVYSNGKIYRAKSFVLSTGGMSHPETGSTGDGFKFLKILGHKVKDPTPSIVPIELEDLWVRELSGTSLSFMKISFYLEGKRQFSKTGKILFTHFGISGPLVLNSSSKVSDLLNAGRVTGFIDVFPDTEHNILDEKIIKIFDSNKNKILRNILKDIAPEGIAKVLRQITNEVDFNKKVHSITKEERNKIIHLLKALPFSVKGLMGYDRAVVADGGVSLSEVDMKTMRSKIYSNLYITGDLLNINRPSGGYGLQLCWTTGYIAGKMA